MRDAEADAYLDRIGAARPAVADLASLRDLMERHLLAVPFENLSIHLGEPIALTEEALLAKIVGRRRGGFCYELNGAFALLLEHLGYAVDLLAARVWSGEAFGPPFAHVALRVRVAGAPGDHLVDVGFGRFLFRPARLDVRGPQDDPGGEVDVVETDDGDLDVHQGGQPQIRLEQRPRRLADAGPSCWFQQSSPDSHFTRSLTCSRPTAVGPPPARVTLSDRTLITTTGATREERTLGPDEDVLAAYRDHFGIVLDRLPAAPPALR